MDLVNQINCTCNRVDESIKWPKIIDYFIRLKIFIYLSNPSDNVILKPYLFYSTSRYNFHPILIVHMLSEFINNAKNNPTLLDTNNLTTMELEELENLLKDKDVKNELKICLFYKRKTLQ